MTSGTRGTGLGGMRGRRLIAVLLVITVVPLGLLGALTFHLARQAIRAEVEARAKSNAAVTSALIQQYMTGLGSIVQSFAQRPALIQALGGGHEPAFDRDQISFHLQELTKASEGIGLAFLAETDGDLVEVVPATPSIIGKNYAFRDWYKGLKASGQTYISEAYQTEATGEALVVAAASYVRPVPGDESSEPLAILVAGYNFETMQRFVDNFAKAQGASISVADQRGVLVVSPDQSVLRIRPQTLDPRIRNGLEGKRGVTRIQTKSGPSLSAYYPVPKIGWVVITEVPERVAFASITALTRALAGALILTAAIIAMGLGFLSRTLRERDRAEIRLLNSEQSLRRYGAIVDSSEDAIISKTLDGTITSWNPGAEKLYGYKAHEVIGRSVSILVPDDRPDEIAGILRDVAAGQAIEHFDTVRVRKDGELVDVSLTVSPVRDGNGEPIGASAIGRDVSIRKKAEGALKESEARFAEAYAKEHAAVEHLEDLNKLKNEFVGVISHDLRSPLAVISGYSKLLLERWDQLDDAKKIAFLGAIERSVQQQEALVDDVLQVARLESADLTFQMSPTDISRGIKVVCEDTAIATDRQITLDIPDDIPLVMADEPRLQRVIQNLISNAIKFSPEQGNVEVAVRTRGDHVEVKVKDHGIGMKPDDLHRVFDKFARVEQPRGGGKIKGTGLGLYITKSFVEGQGGTIWVESEAGEGSTFTFTLPIAGDP